VDPVRAILISPSRQCGVHKKRLKRPRFRIREHHNKGLFIDLSTAVGFRGDRNPYPLVGEDFKDVEGDASR
jgi:hypothetical protein